MGWAFRCPKTGLVEFTDCGDTQRCPFCPESHAPYEIGVKAEEGFPNVIGDKLVKHFDWAAGCEITSKAQRRRVYAKKGLVLSSVAEDRRKRGLSKEGVSYSYTGQPDHRSSAEKDGVRTATGQRVI